MNLLLLDSRDPVQHLPADDRRAVHVREILHKGAGDTLLVGVVGGPRAMATIESFDDRGSDLVLRIDWATGDPRAPIVP
ncbi:MAG: hypothetical protein AB7S36_10760, partial [Planctomycetota bacterium]